MTRTNRFITRAFSVALALLVAACAACLLMDAGRASAHAATKYKILYKLNGGKHADGYKKKIREGKTLKVKRLAKPKRTGHVFKGWYKDKKFREKAKRIKGSSDKAARTLYAKWKKATYAISYELNGGTQAPGQPVKYKYAAKRVQLKDPVRPGYVFEGWFKDEAMTEHVPYIAKKAHKNLVLRAKWYERFKVAHRGYRLTAPENTLAAFRLAKQHGFDCVETDVRFTADSVPVLLHDGELNRTARTADGQELPAPVSVESATFEEVRSYDYGSWKSEAFAGEQIPSFEEFLDLCRELDMRAFVELKVTPDAPISTLVDLAREHGMAGRITWISFNLGSLSRVHELDAHAPLSFVVSGATDARIDAVHDLIARGYDISLDMSMKKMTAQRTRRCKESGVPLAVWGVPNADNPASFDSYIYALTADS